MMHKEFGDWYRAAGIEPDGELLPKRWAGIEKFTISRDQIVSLARLFYGLGKPSDTFLDSFRAVFHDTDAAFQMSGNDQELVVLAGAKLVHVIQQANQDAAAMSALSLVSAAAQNLRRPAPVAHILRIAAKYMNERAVSRSSSAKGEDKIYEQDNALCESLKSQPAPWDTFAPVFERLLDENRYLKQELSMVSEESNMLWWLFSGYSRDLEKAWTTLSFPATAIIAGKELADLTRVIPGPIAATAFLDKAIRRAGVKPEAKITIKDALNNTPHDWRQQFAGENNPAEMLDLTPISHGIRLSLTGPGETWLAAFNQTVGFSADSEIIPYILAYQIYLEALLCRTWRILN